MGDFNCDLLILLPDNKTSFTNRLVDIINLFQLTQVIEEPTRITSDTQTLLDLFITNKPENIINSGVVQLGISDHNLIFGCRKLSLGKNQPKIVETRNYKYYKSCGQDKIPSTLLKDSCEISAYYLTFIYNCSLATGIFPDDWKVARISPIYKSGDKQECGNYRPISVLSVAAKVFEKLMSDQLNGYLRKENILTKSQSGFRKGHSTNKYSCIQGIYRRAKLEH